MAIVHQPIGTAARLLALSQPFDCGASNDLSSADRQQTARSVAVRHSYFLGQVRGLAAAFRQLASDRAAVHGGEQ